MALRSGCTPGCSGGGGGSGTCAEFMVGCLCPNVDMFLECTPEGRLTMGPSNDAGNMVQRGTDGRIFVPGSGTPPPDTGRKTIAGLPAQFFGGFGTGNLITPMGSPAGVEHLVAKGIDWLDNAVATTSDGTSMFTPYSSTNQVAAYSTNTSTNTMSQISTGEARGLFVDAGNPYEPMSQNQDISTPDSDPTGRDQNWYGWKSATWTLPTTAEMLERVNARAVVYLNCGLATDVAPAVAAVAIARAQTWCIVGVNVASLSSASTVTAAGMTAGLFLDTDTTLTPAAIVAAGVTWVIARYTQTDARLNALAAAGLNVVVLTDSTHRQTGRVRTTLVGMRGVTCGDPVYARGQLATAAALSYRRTTLEWSSKGIHYGGLTRRTANFQVLDGRGYTTNAEDGHVLEQQYQWIDGSTPVGYAGTNLWELMPLANPAAYTIEYYANIRNTQATSNGCKFGVLFGLADDRDFAVTDITVAQPGVNGYWAFIRPGNGSLGGQLVIGKITNGLYTELAVSATRQPWGLNAWGRFTLQVTATGITFTRYRTADQYAVTVNDTSYRGPYAKESKDEVTGSGGTFNLLLDRWTVT